MLLSEIFYEHKDKYKFLDSYTKNVIKKTNIFYIIIIESSKNKIQLEIEETTGYVSILFEQKNKKEFFYALADYSYIKGAKRIFDVLNTIDQEKLYKEIRDCIKRRYKIIRKERVYQIRLVELVYDLLEKFLKWIEQNPTTI